MYVLSKPESVDWAHAQKLIHSLTKREKKNKKRHGRKKR